MVVCHFCHKKIIEGQRRVHYTEEELGKEVDFDISFHGKCWEEKYALSLDMKVKEYAKKMMAATLPRVQHEMEARGMLQ